MSIISLSQKDLTDWSAFRLFEIAVVAVFDLGGAERSVDTEDIAIRCHEIAEAAFSWRKYPSQANLELVRVCLSDAKKPKNGGLLTGTGREGWRLTRRGLTWIEVVATSRAKSKAIVSRRSGGSIDTVRKNREAARIEGSPGWQTWRGGQGIRKEDARSLFRIDSYASSQMVEIKVTRMLALLDADSEHHAFLEAAAKTLGPTGGLDARTST